MGRGKKTKKRAGLSVKICTVTVPPWGHKVCGVDQLVDGIFLSGEFSEQIINLLLLIRGEVDEL